MLLLLTLLNLFIIQLISLTTSNQSIQLSNSNLYQDSKQIDPITPFFLIIFGSKNSPWNIQDWQEVSDKVRGGDSEAKIDYIDHPHHERSQGGITFYGHLDTKKLNGAGFATQVYQHPLELPLIINRDHHHLNLSAFFLEIEPIHHHHHPIHTFTFAVSNQPSNQPPNQSKLIYQFDFQPPTITTTTTTTVQLDQLIRIIIPFNKLIPTYRGRTQPDQKPFNPHQISQISFMVRSFFNQQSGSFQLNIRRLGVQ